MNTLSTSRLATFFACPRRYFLHYLVGRIPLGESAALSIGKAWHSAMEKWWMEGLEAAVDYLRTNAGAIDVYDVAKLCALLEFYNPPRPAEILGVEVEFCMSIKNPDGKRAVKGYRLSGRIDGLFPDAVLEHKTTSEEIEGFPIYWQRLRFDPQVSNYCIAFQKSKVYYDVVRKIQLRPGRQDEQRAAGTGETVVEAFLARCRKEVEENPEKYYQFRLVDRTPEELEDAARNLYQQVVMLRSCHSQGTFPQNSGSCRGLYGYCPYLEVCAGTADIMDDTLFKDRREQGEREDKPAE